MIQRPLYRTVLQSIGSYCRIKNYGKEAGNDGNHETKRPKTHRQRFLRQSQGLHAFRPAECPEKPTVILFPGQGAQFVGMAKSLVDIPAATELFDIASEILR